MDKKMIFAGLAGIIIGASGSYLYIKKVYDEKFAEFKEECYQMIDDENEKTKADYEERLKAVKEQTEENVRAAIVDKIKETYTPAKEEAEIEAEPEEEKIFLKSKAKKEMTNYTKYGNKKNLIERYEDELTEEEFDEGEDDGEIVRTGMDDEDLIPYSITKEDFMASEYEKEHLIFYKADQILSDDMGNEFDGDLDDTVGREWLMEVGSFSEDTAYIRNDKIKMDYEITVDETSYEENWM